MKFLRTVSTRRLLAMIAGLVAAIVAGTAIAVAAAGAGPVPARKPLAQAIHGALAAPAVTGVYARISFTNHLIDASNIEGTDPILQGASGRIWVSTRPTHRQLRLELQGSNGDAQVVVDNQSFWIYDPTSNTIYEGTIPAQSANKSSTGKSKNHGDAGALPSVAQIQRGLNQFVRHVSLSDAIPSDVGGRPTYTVRVSPQHDAGLLGAVELAWDSRHGIPLRIAVYARGDGSPVLELKATGVSYGPVSEGVFEIKPPAGAKVVRVSSPAAAAPAAAAAAVRAHAKRHSSKPVTGPAAVARHLSFKLVAPAALVGLPRQSVQLLDWGGSPAALVSYGQNLGGIAVIEQPAGSAGAADSQSQSNGGDQQGLSLPSISINGATGHELDTALGTMVQFTRAGVSYTVIGSVTPWAAELAARRL
jgi:outer membrane lipoprotein-sorting protein